MVDEKKPNLNSRLAKEVAGKGQLGAKSKPWDIAGKTLGKGIATGSRLITDQARSGADALSDLADVANELPGVLGKGGAAAFKFASGVAKISDSFRDLQKPLMQATALTGDLTGSLLSSTDAMGRFSDSIASSVEVTGMTFQETNEHVSNLLKTSSEMASGIGDAGDQLSKVEKTFQGFTKAVQVARNIGMDLNEVLSTQKELFLVSGMSMDESTNAILQLKAATKDTGITVQQVTKEFQNLAQTYEFLRFDSTQTAHALGQVANIARENTDAFKSPQQAIKIYREGLQGVAKVQEDLSQSTFFGTMAQTGGRRGLGAALEFETLTGQEAMRTVTEQIGQMFGGRGLVTREEAMEGGPEATRAFIGQRKMLQQTLGTGQALTTKLMDLTAAMERGETGAAKKIDSIMSEAQKTDREIQVSDATFQKNLLNSTAKMNQALSDIRMLALKQTDALAGLAYDKMPEYAGRIEKLTGKGIESFKGMAKRQGFDAQWESSLDTSRIKGGEPTLGRPDQQIREIRQRINQQKQRSNQEEQKKQLEEQTRQQKITRPSQHAAQVDYQKYRAKDFTVSGGMNTARYGIHAKKAITAGHVAGTEQARYAFTQARMAGVLGKGSTALEGGQAMPKQGMAYTTPKEKFRPATGGMDLAKFQPGSRVSLTEGLRKGQLSEGMGPQISIQSGKLPSAQQMAMQNSAGQASEILSQQKKHLNDQEQRLQEERQKQTMQGRAEQQSTEPAKIILNVDGNALAEALVSTDAFKQSSKKQVNEYYTSIYKNAGNKTNLT